MRDIEASNVDQLGAQHSGRLSLSPKQKNELRGDPTTAHQVVTVRSCAVLIQQTVAARS